tara:strand:+ start:92 stop:793 length:702 start_codon:yes stop_codon:yes gene_type:complete
MKQKNEYIVALIPARAGSKGIKNKNTKEVGGKPLIEHTIIAAERTSFIENIFISTDSEHIKEKYKSRVEIINRPSKYASDSSTAVAVVKHFIRTTKKILPEDYFIIYLQPTSPLRDANDIEKCFEDMKKNKKSSAVSVVKNRFSPFKSFKLNKTGGLKPLFSEYRTNQNRQNLPKTYRSNGAIYIFKKSSLEKKNSFPSMNAYPYIMEEDLSIDVDDINDIIKIEKFLAKNKK